MLETVLSILHVVTAIVLTAVILVQSGKGEGIGAGLGGASAAAQKMFGGGGTQSALAKATVGIALVFMGTSLTLAYLSSQPESAMDLQKGEADFGNRRGTVVKTGGSEGDGAEEGADSPGAADSSGAAGGSESSSGAAGGDDSAK